MGALVKNKLDDFFSLLEQREAYIARINKLDEAAGTILMNDEMERQLQDILAFEKKIQLILQQLSKKLGQQVRFAQNETFLTKQYEESISVSRGIFYDEKK